MTFANPLPWWALLIVVAGGALLSWQTYRRFAHQPVRRCTLSGLRFTILMVLVLVLMRPVARISDADARDAFVPILVDTSRSMGIEDADGSRRVDRARKLLSTELLPALSGKFQVDVLAFGERLAPSSLEALDASARRSDLAGALDQARNRYRGRPVAGIILLSDGGDTTRGTVRRRDDLLAPVYAYGIGSERIGSDREVLSVTAAEAVLDESRIDLAVSATAHGSRGDSTELRLLENGRPLEVRRVRASDETGPVREVFHVAPSNNAPTVYTIEIPAIAGELVPENNARSVLVQPPVRKRRVLLFEGAPGFEHSFLKRALADDASIELDSVVRKGTNEQGIDTFYIQAARSRSAALERGFPDSTPLFVYDAIILANVSGDQLNASRLEATKAFVARRGGGLLVLGAQSFGQKGLTGTPLEDVLPVTLVERSDALHAAVSRGANRVSMTEAGLRHPIMQLATWPDDTRKRWEEMPPLAAAAFTGSTRPGSSVLATIAGAGGVSRALAVVQRYGEGRSMVFTGEASWRWRMLLPSTDRTYDTFWRQAVRWLAIGATDPVAIVPVASTSPGDVVTVRTVVRDADFQPIRDAQVDVRISGPDGRVRQSSASVEEASTGGPVFSAQFVAEQPGIHKMTVAARRRGAGVGSSSSSFLVGGADVEMTDPRLNLPVLARLAAASGGRVLRAGETSDLLAALRANVPAAALAVRRDVWHSAWSLLAIIGLLAAEWIARRKWGLR